MKKTKNKIIITFSILICIVLTTGCIDLNEFFNGSSNNNDNTVTYVKSPTKISYTISYGYNVAVNGAGNYTIKYSCDKPEILHQNGQTTITQVFEPGYTNETVATYNDVLKWNIQSTTSQSYKLGLEAQITAESYMISDLNGTNALTISQIQNQNSDLYDQYTKIQGNQTIVYIDPNNSDIKNISSKILKQTKTNNAFQIAKNLFIWLKEETSYERHTVSNNVQTCTETLKSLKGDCDDLSFLYISLLRSAEIPSRFIRGFLVNNNNGVISLEPHAWVEVFVGEEIGKNGWIPVECACNSDDMELQVYQNFGIESANHLRLYKDEGSNESLNISLTGLRIKYSEDLSITQSSFETIESYQILESKSMQIKDNYRTYQ